MTPLHGRRAVVFDLDGTLIDSAPSLHRAVSLMMIDRGLPAPDLETVTGFVGNGVPKLVERALRWAGQPMDDGAVHAFRTIYDADPMTGTVVFDGAHDLLAALRSKGLRLGLCTNKPMAPTMTLLNALKLGPFEAVIGGDSLPVRKPDPAPLLATLDQMTCPPDAALYVGDSVTDHRTASAANVAYVHVECGYANGSIEGDAPLARFATLAEFSQIVTEL
ncbi:phosphoglycolate phosphatase [Jannaschia pagri]|uniref:phosphoglycolate phosphatase n=1 Tax=Jannaschia pagri TaxID=2829797 RepID=A0ABQ4NJV1_9RHOB|nr:MULTISPECIES: phosphoglycolate phosphatase [unclassified Jannaschia]GIT90835.1 phosphoglycolate phosphatase [Jannaschia sp. AI_61]GIT94667.1 phosphoglycolate phosphatase [Jannaschia sp. AI_62]